MLQASLHGHVAALRRSIGIGGSLHLLMVLFFYVSRGVYGQRVDREH